MPPVLRRVIQTQRRWSSSAFHRSGEPGQKSLKQMRTCLANLHPGVLQGPVETSTTKRLMIIGLPSELLLSVLCLVSASDLMMLRSVCRRLRDLIAFTRRTKRRILYHKFMQRCTTRVPLHFVQRSHWDRGVHTEPLWSQELHRTDAYLDAFEFTASADSHVTLILLCGNERMWYRDILISKDETFRTNISVPVCLLMYHELNLTIKVRGQAPVPSVQAVYTTFPFTYVRKVINFNKRCPAVITRRVYYHNRFLCHFTFQFGISGAIVCNARKTKDRDCSRCIELSRRLYVVHQVWVD